MSRVARHRLASRRVDADRGAVDVSVQMLFAAMALLLVIVLIFEATAYWHARNVFDDAAAEGARVAAAQDGTCTLGVAATRRMISLHAGGWGRGVTVRCTAGDVITITVAGPTPGVLSSTVGLRAVVRAVTPKEH